MISREGDGIVSVETTAHNQDGDIVMQFERSMLIPTREKGTPDDEVTPDDA